MSLTHISCHHPRVQQCVATVNKAFEEQTHSTLHTKECGLWVSLLSWELLERRDKWDAGGVGEWNDLAMLVLWPLKPEPSLLARTLLLGWMCGTGCRRGGERRKESGYAMKNSGSEVENPRLLLHTWPLSKKEIFSFVSLSQRPWHLIYWRKTPFVTQVFCPYKPNKPKSLFILLSTWALLGCQAMKMISKIIG